MLGHRQTYKQPRDLPIYRATMQIMSTIDDIHDDFQRDRRHTLWQQLCNESGKLPYLVCVANDFPKHREEALMIMLGIVSVMQSKLELCKTRGYISDKSYLAFAKPFSSIERQANGWLNQTRQARVGNGSAESAESYKGDSILTTQLFGELRTS